MFGHANKHNVQTDNKIEHQRHLQTARIGSAELLQVQRQLW